MSVVQTGQYETNRSVCGKKSSSFLYIVSV